MAFGVDGVADRWRLVSMASPTEGVGVEAPGRSQALLLATAGERIDAAEALRIGLFDRDAHWAAADALTRKLLVPEGEDRGLDPVLEAEFGEDAADVGLDRLLADRQVLGDLTVAVAAGDQPEHLAFAG
jgi:enoyl-CoA hydratase/carnithine racemase